jgi:tRNA threonylcarbamoyladenosine biosynthesis protein TsaE
VLPHNIEKRFFNVKQASKPLLKEISIAYMSPSVEKTMWLGQELGNQLAEGDVIALIGDLGGGKTWFTKGVARGLGIGSDSIVSPTFTLVNEYHGIHPLYHIDLYRLTTNSEVIALGLEEYLSGKGIAVIEWADRWPDELPEDTIQVELRMVNEHTRELRFSGTHARAREVLRRLKQRVGNSLHTVK